MAYRGEVSNLKKLKQCKSCLGVYDQGQTDGYYHSCPEGTLEPRDENIQRKYMRMSSKEDKPKMKKEGKGVKDV